MNSTIAAISTAPAAAGIGVVRLSGPEALVVADRIFRSPRKGQSLKELPGYTARFGHVYDLSLIHIFPCQLPANLPSTVQMTKIVREGNQLL